MKTKSLLLSLILVVGVLAFNSCSKDDDPAPLTQENAELAIDDANADFEAVSADLVTSDGYKLQDQLYDMGLPFSYTKKSTKKAFGNIDVEALKANVSKSFKATKGGDINFDFDYFFDINFDEYKGTWEWSNGEFTKTLPTPEDKIVVKFPYPYNNATNNATLTYSDYKYNSSTEMMTGLKCEIKVGDVVKLSIVYSGSYSESMTSMSMSQKYDATFGVYNFLQEVSASGSGTQTSFKVNVNASVTLKKSGEIKYRESVNFAMSGNQTKMNFVFDARLRLSNLELRLNMAFDSDNAETLFNPESDPNQFIKMAIYTAGGAKVGDIKFKKVEGEWMPYFVYSNGTEVSADEALGMMFDRMGNFFEDLFDLMYEFY